MANDMIARGLAVKAQKGVDVVNERINQLPNGYIAKGEVPTYADLPLTGNEIGDSYTVQNADPEHKAGHYAWGYSHGVLKWYYSDGDNDYATQTELEDEIGKVTIAVDNAQTAADNAQTTADSKSIVSVAEIGSSSNEIKYVTVDGAEYKIAQSIIEVDLSNSGDFNSITDIGAYLVKFNNTTNNRPFNSSVTYSIFLTVLGKPNEDIVQNCYLMLRDGTNRQTTFNRSWIINEGWSDWGGSHAITAAEKTSWDNKQNAIDNAHKLLSDLVSDAGQINKFVSSTDISSWNNKSTVSVANAGTSANTVSYITVDGTEYKLATGGIPTVDLTRSGDFNSVNAIGAYIVKFDNTTAHRPFSSGIECLLFMTVTGMPEAASMYQTTYRVFPDNTHRQTIYTRPYVLDDGWLDSWSASHAITSAEKISWDGKSTVSVSDTGTSSSEVSYITVNGMEYKLAGGAGIPFVDLTDGTHANDFNDITDEGFYNVKYNRGTTNTPNAIMNFVYGAASSAFINLFVYKNDYGLIHQVIIFDSFTCFRIYDPSQSWAQWQEIKSPNITATDVVID